MDEGVKDDEVHSSCMAISGPLNPQLATRVMVDNEIPIIEVGMQRRNTD